MSSVRCFLSCFNIQMFGELWRIWMPAGFMWQNWRLKRLNPYSAHLYQHHNVWAFVGFSHRLKTIQLLQLLLCVHRCYFVFNTFCQDNLIGQNSLYPTVFIFKSYIISVCRKHVCSVTGLLMMKLVLWAQLSRCYTQCNSQQTSKRKKPLLPLLRCVSEY